MKAIEMHKFGSKEVFEESDVLKPSPGHGEVCIQIKASGFNPVDCKLRGGWFPIVPNQILGCDCSGVVESVGEGTPSFSIGDEVYSICGSFFRCSNGGYAEYVCVPAELVAKKPANLTFEEAAAVPLAAMTAYRATLAVSAIKAGDAVFVAGLGGGVGTFAAQFLWVADVENVYTVAKDENSAAFLQKELGMRRDHILIYDGLSCEELKEKLIEMNGGKFFDATLDLVGGKVKKLCLELTGYSGHFSTILPESDFQWFDVWSENSIPRGRNLSIHQVAIGAELGSQDRKTWQIYRRHLELISQMIESEQVRPIVQNIGPLSAKTVQKAHELLEEGHVKGKLIMKVG